LHNGDPDVRLRTVSRSVNRRLPVTPSALAVRRQWPRSGHCRRRSWAIDIGRSGL